MGKSMNTNQNQANEDLEKNEYFEEDFSGVCKWIREIQDIQNYEKESNQFEEK